MKKPILAIISPCFNEEEIINTTYEKLNEILDNLKSSEKISNESFISFVDDGSTDNTWEILSNLNIKGIKLSKNFGHQSAILAGLTENNADIYITLDADLQDDISLIKQMVDQYYQGFEIVYGVRKDRNSDVFLKKIFSEFYYKLTELLKMQTIPNHSDFRLVSDKIVQLLRENKEQNLYLRGIIPNFGFKNTKLYYSRQKRIGGSAKYNYFSLTKLAVDGITSFSIVPLRLITILGLLCFFIAIIMSIYSIFSFATHKIVTGWTSLFTSVYFLGGIQLLSIGIIGEYLGKIYLEVKQRPQFIVEKKINE